VTRFFSRSTALAFAALIQLACMSSCDQIASAGNVELSSVDLIGKSFRVPVTDPVSHLEIPAVLLVSSARLTSRSPGDRSTMAPKGSLFLSLQATCGPVQNTYGDPEWGEFFSNMTPLPATALRYVTASGRSYPATRIDPISQMNNSIAATDDGLFDATYYFKVPISNRIGAIEILPSRTQGTQYEGFVGVATTALVTGGPVKVAVHFTRELTLAAKRAPPGLERATPPAYSTFASMLNIVSTIFGLSVLGIVCLRIRRSRRRREMRYRRAHVPDGPIPSPPVSTVVSDQPVPSWPVRLDAASAVPTETNVTLRVDVLGSLTLAPTFAPSSDPVRAIVAFLATHTERPLTLEEIQNAIWPLTDKGNDIKRPAMRNYMVNVRKVVGDHHLPTASGRPGYQLVDAKTDWAEFQGLVKRALGADKRTAQRLRREALSLVRGEPFTAETSRYFTWAFSSAVVYKIVEAVTGLAHAVATEMVLASDLVGAEWALRQGLLCDPVSLTLWEDLTDVLLDTADQSLLALHWKAAVLVLSPKDVVALRAREHG